jgi:hypothetical protein
MAGNELGVASPYRVRTPCDVMQLCPDLGLLLPCCLLHWPHHNLRCCLPGVLCNDTLSGTMAHTAQLQQQTAQQEEAEHAQRAHPGYDQQDEQHQTLICRERVPPGVGQTQQFCPCCPWWRAALALQLTLSKKIVVLACTGRGRGAQGSLCPWCHTSSVALIYAGA